MRSITIIFTLLLFPLIFCASCQPDKPEDPIIPNEEELITSLNYRLTPAGGGADVLFSFQDSDGDGGNAPSITEGKLKSMTSYTGSIELLNETENPAEDITEEVQEEDEEHQLFYQTSVAGLDIEYNDLDANSQPLGLSTVLTTNEVGSGTLTIVLRHEPNKSASGVSSGDITNAGGETDIEVTFNLVVE